MPSETSLTTSLRAYRETRFREIQARRRQVASRQILASLTHLADEIVGVFYQKALEDLPPTLREEVLEKGLVLVALGGYGRGELSPYSDVDILFLYERSCQELAQKASKSILHGLYDTGYSVGHSLRTLEDCLLLAKSDYTIRTALLEARLIVGAKPRFDRFYTRLYQQGLWNGKAYMKAKIQERQEEWTRYGANVYLLEPHVKLSRGGLRDIHLLQWLALHRYRTESLESLKEIGLLGKEDYQALGEAQSFLWTIRNDLHFSAGRRQDQLTFDEQLRLAQDDPLPNEEHLLPVEQFMKQYYEKTAEIRDITLPLAEEMYPPSIFLRIKRHFRHKVIDDLFRIQGDEIGILPEACEKVLGHLPSLLRLFYLAQVYNLKPSSKTCDHVKRFLQVNGRSRLSLNGEEEEVQMDRELSKEGGKLFLQMLSVPGQVGWMLRELHRLRLLEEIVPSFRKARGLMQFNAYHKYTVDEHSLRAVEEAEKFLQDSGHPGQIYRAIHQRDILHLALLLHDIGKGEGADHSAIGAQIAETVAVWLGLDLTAKAILILLVKHHLLMPHLAFRRDLSDPKVPLRLARTTATPETLKMLYIFSLCDIAAVGAGTLTDWKRELLREIFENTLSILTGEDPGAAETEKEEEIRLYVKAHAEGMEREWVEKQISCMPRRYLLATPPIQIIKDLQEIRSLSLEKVRATAEYDLRRKITEYTVYTLDDLTKGIFSKICGVLAASGLQILGAHITTWRNRVVVDTFQVEDIDFPAMPSPERLREICQTLQDVLLGHGSVEALLARGQRRRPRRVPLTVATQVEIDSLTSDDLTILEVFASDRPGLLYVIAKTIFEAGLSVHAAKVSTQLDQIVDVFYVTNASGGKIGTLAESEELKAKLIRAIDHFLAAQ